MLKTAVLLQATQFLYMRVFIYHYASRPLHSTKEDAQP
jgi:hypothetical protein